MSDLSMGRLLTQLREACGRSQAEQATLLSTLSGQSITRHEVSRWEHEKRLLSKFWLPYTAVSFGVDVDVLQRAVAVSRRARRERQEVSRQPEPDMGYDMHRRQFMRSFAGFAIGLPHLDISKNSNIGFGEVSQLVTRTARIRRIDDYIGGIASYDLYASELAWTEAFAKRINCTEGVQQALVGVIAEQAQMAGWAAFDAGMNDQARRHWKRSKDAARDARSPTLEGNSLAFMAYLESVGDRPDVSTAIASYVTAEKYATPKVRALLLERMAWTHAVTRDFQATHRALALAEEAIHEDGNEKEPDWVFWVDPVEIQIMTGRCWTELQRPLRAVPTLEKALKQYSDMHARDKALYSTWLAKAYFDAGEPEQAALTIDQSLNLAVGVGSVRPFSRIKKVARLLESHRSSPTVQRMLDRVERAIPE
ncbi:hypothetical protein ACFQ1S_00445 [Kibdelosporangium lantanae]|uniref:XRE family transcriptional regulator n=1 Tax=Kibdelosporangium lantanae TaxID=1497396 RepID=A0ABW3M477_9PSEU